MATILRTRATLTGPAGLPGLSTFYWLDPSPSDSNATAALAGVRAYFEAVKSLLATGVTVLYQQEVDVLNDATGGLVAQQTATAQTSTIATGTDEAPPATQLGLTLLTGTVVDGRILKGRTFLGPVAPACFTAAGVPTGTAKTALNAGGAAMLAVSAVDLCVWSRPKGGSGGIAVACSGVSAATQAWVLRSRRDG